MYIIYIKVMQSFSLWFVTQMYVILAQIFMTRLTKCFSAPVNFRRAQLLNALFTFLLSVQLLSLWRELQDAPIGWRWTCQLLQQSCKDFAFDCEWIKLKSAFFLVSFEFRVRIRTQGCDQFTDVDITNCRLLRLRKYWGFESLWLVPVVNTEQVNPNLKRILLCLRSVYY